MERRSEPRETRFEPALIRLKDGRPARHCVLTNLSRGGARLQLVGVVTLPAQFSVCILATGEVRSARLVWRRPGRCGVRFLSS